MEYQRLENETDAQLILRICQLKDQIGTWTEVANILNEITKYNLSERTYRRRYKELSCSGTEGAHTGIEESRKERIKLQILNLERNRLDRAAVRQELFYEYIGKAITALPLPDFAPIAKSEDPSLNKEYVLTLADIHYGATFLSQNNEYSPKIVEERLEYLSGLLYGFISRNNITTLHIVSLGDMIQGILRINDVKVNDSSVVKSVVEISRLIALFLNDVSKYTCVNYYHVPTANHSQIRPLGSKANELVDEDLEFVIGNYISDLCKANNRIQVFLAEPGKQYLEIPIFGYTIVAMHGHQIKNMDTALKDLSSILDDPIDYLLLGHFHSSKEISGAAKCNYDSEILISPSFMGPDLYSDSLFRSSKAAVKIYGFDYIYGHTETYKFILN